MSKTNELSVTRHIAAKPAKVWDVMVNRTEEWWWPKPWRAEIDHQDRRPLGACNMTFYGPDGEKSPQNGVYLAYDEGRRFVTTDAVTADFQPSGPFMIGIWEIEPKAKAPATRPAPATGARKPPSSTRKWASPKAGASVPTS